MKPCKQEHPRREMTVQCLDKACALQCGDQTALLPHPRCLCRCAQHPVTGADWFKLIRTILLCVAAKRAWNPFGLRELSGSLFARGRGSRNLFAFLVNGDKCSCNCPSSSLP